MRELQPLRDLVIVTRPINVPLFRDDLGVVWARLTKYCLDCGLSKNNASKLASDYRKEDPDRQIFHLFKFSDGAGPEWCVNLYKLREIMKGRRETNVTMALWRLLDTFDAFKSNDYLTNEADSTRTPLEEAAKKAKSKTPAYSFVNSDLSFSTSKQGV